MDDESQIKPILTIHTATYNRAYILPEAFKSLCAQTCFDFEWIITDDGSTDQTVEMIRRWQAEKLPFDILLDQQQHGGKCRALNSGMRKARGRYFFMLDSDDVLTPDAVETIIDSIAEIDSLEMYVGVGFLRTYRNGEPIKGVHPRVNSEGYVDCTNLERCKYDLDADMCEAYKLEILKRYPFPSWPGEDFAPEQITLNSLALDGYRIRWYDKGIYLCEYLDDGLTKGSMRLLAKNKMGYAMMYNHMLLYTAGLKQRFYLCSQMIALSLLAGNPLYVFTRGSAPCMCMVAYPVGLLLAFRRYLQFKECI